MTAKELSIDEVRRMAEELGMHRLANEYAQELLRATNAARARRQALKVDTLEPADEPAHVFRLKDA